MEKDWSKNAEARTFQGSPSESFAVISFALFKIGVCFQFDSCFVICCLWSAQPDTPTQFQFLSKLADHMVCGRNGRSCFLLSSGASPGGKIISVMVSDNSAGSRFPYMFVSVQAIAGRVGWGACE